MQKILNGNLLASSTSSLNTSPTSSQKFILNNFKQENYLTNNNLQQQQYFLQNRAQQQNLFNFQNQQQQQQSPLSLTSLTSSQLNDYFKLNNLNETSMPLEMMMTVMSLNGLSVSNNNEQSSVVKDPVAGGDDCVKIKKSYSREMTPDSIDSSLTSSISGSVADSLLIKNNKQHELVNEQQNILDSNYFKSSSSCLDELNYNLEQQNMLIPTQSPSIQPALQFPTHHQQQQLNQLYLQQQLLLLQQQQQHQPRGILPISQPAPPANVLLQQQLYYQQLQQLLIKQQEQLLQLQQLQSQTQANQPNHQKSSQIPVATKKLPKPACDQQNAAEINNSDETNCKKVKRYPDLLNIKSAAGIGKRLAYAVSSNNDEDNSNHDNPQQITQKEYENEDNRKLTESQVKIEDSKVMPKLEEGLSNDEDENRCDDRNNKNKMNEFKLKSTIKQSKTSDFIYNNRKPADDGTAKGNNSVE